MRGGDGVGLVAVGLGHRGCGAGGAGLVGVAAQGALGAAPGVSAEILTTVAAVIEAVVGHGREAALHCDGLRGTVAIGIGEDAVLGVDAALGFGLDVAAEQHRGGDSHGESGKQQREKTDGTFHGGPCQQLTTGVMQESGLAQISCWCGVEIFLQCRFGNYVFDKPKEEGL